jgi:hypothetical protein
MGTQNGNRSQFFTEVLASIAKAEFDLAGTADHIGRLLEGMEAVPGRKHIVLVSAGQISNDRGGPRLNTDTLARQLGEWAARANATIDSLFIERNMVSLNTADQRVPPVTMTNLARDRIILERTLDQYADASGGTVFPIMAGAGEYAFKGIALQTSAFYLLGVEAAESDKDGAPHEISVKVTAPGATIRARQWFTMPGSSSSAAPVRDPFAGWNLANATEPMTVDAMVFRGAGADDRAAVALVVDRSAAPDAAAENVEVVAAASSSPTGSPMDQQRTTLRLSWNDATATRDYEVWSRLSLPPGRYDLRIGARMDNTRVGVKTITVDVPDFTNDALSMSGLALFAARRSTVAHADALNGLLLSPPTGRRTFDGADRVRVLVRVYQGRSTTVAPVTVTMHVTDAAGKPVADGETRLEAAAFAPDRSADYETDLPVQDLTPGHYLLTLTATAAGTAVARTLSFMVQ